MTNSDKLELVKFGLQEIKDQYNTYLNGFDDIREKCQFFLLICSLVITFPLSSSLLLNKVISSGNFFLGLYLSGLILFC